MTNSANRPDKAKTEPRNLPIFACVECGHQFKTTASAERASMNGCPGCGGVDIDLAG